MHCDYVIVGDECGVRFLVEVIFGGFCGVDGLFGEFLVCGVLVIDFELLLEVEVDVWIEFIWRSIYVIVNLEVGVVGRVDARRGALCACGFEVRVSV